MVDYVGKPAERHGISLDPKHFQLPPCFQVTGNDTASIPAFLTRSMKLEESSLLLLIVFC